MAKSTYDRVNGFYIISVLVLTFALPAISYCLAKYFTRSDSGALITELGKWFIFYAVGFRLTLAGIRQITKPAFTARTIFQMESIESYVVIRELGFANLCFGLIGIMSLFFPSWRMVSAFGSGLYYGLAGLQHAFKKNAGINQKFALYTDIVIFCFLALLFCQYCY